MPVSVSVASPSAPWRCPARFAGLAGSVEIAGVHQRLQDNFAAGFGLEAIAVALMARLHPIAIPFTAVSVRDLLRRIERAAAADVGAVSVGLDHRGGRHPGFLGPFRERGARWLHGLADSGPCSCSAAYWPPEFGSRCRSQSPRWAKWSDNAPAYSTSGSRGSCCSDRFSRRSGPSHRDRLGAGWRSPALVVCCSVRCTDGSQLFSVPIRSSLASPSWSLASASPAFSFG